MERRVGRPSQDASWGGKGYGRESPLRGKAREGLLQVRQGQGVRLFPGPIFPKQCFSAFAISSRSGGKTYFKNCSSCERKEHRSEMEAAEAIVHPAEILEQIWQHNLSLENAFLNSEGNKNIAEYIPKLIPPLLHLVKTLRYQLEQTANILQNTSHLLTTLHGKGCKQVSSPEEGSLADWLLGLSKHILDSVGYLGESQKGLLEMSCTKADTVEKAPCIFGKSDASKEKVKGSVQLNVPVNQPFYKPLSMKEGSQPQLMEDEVVESETIISLHEEISSEEQRSSVLVKNGNKNTPDKAGRGPNKDNERSDNSIKSSEYIGLEDIPGNNGNNVVVSRELEAHRINCLQILPHQEQQTKIKEIQEQGENDNHWLIEKPEKCSNLSQDKSSGITQCDQECSTMLKDVPQATSTDLPTSNLKEEDHGNDWIYKEFLVEVNGESEPEVACSVTAPCSVLKNLIIKIVNDLSSLVVDDSEELVSNVVSAEPPQDGQPIVSPIIIAIPFTSRYRGMYRDIMVKVTDTNFQSCYLAPISLEGHQGNFKGTFAEVKTCQLGIFSVVSCLKKETFTIPKKGILRKLSMDPRISFSCPPSTFNSRVTMHLKVQPVEPSAISLLKTKNEMYHSVVSTSPLVHLQHPSSKPFNKSVTVILPCPPNQEKKTEGDEADHGRVSSASLHRVTAMHHFRVMSASPRKHGENLNESLTLLGYRNKEEEWSSLDNITVRNAQNGLVSFELDEPLDKFIILRLSSAMDNTHLVEFIQNLEEVIYNAMVKVVLYHKKEDPYTILIEIFLSKELNLELQSLHEEGYCGPPEPSQPFKMREGEQVHFRFSGNIFASDDGTDFGKTYKLTFHAQRKPRLVLKIKEIDEFGNYSSPHYKGTVLCYIVNKETIAKNLEQPLSLDDFQHQPPVCKLVLTLPKKEKLIKRPQSTKRISADFSEALWDNLLSWLSQELSEDEASCLALCLPLHRSTLQLIKLKCPDNLSAQIYELLCFWKRNLPRSADKLQLLSRYLSKTGRGDLVEELRFQWENKIFERRTC
uniref:Death domain-containing protein 1 isoform X1 n=1 Tax=Pogona vitticeps TaxID=103695 RepID=A0A6J0SZL5_9SAUR